MGFQIVRIPTATWWGTVNPKPYTLNPPNMQNDSPPCSLGSRPSSRLFFFSYFGGPGKPEAHLRRLHRPHRSLRFLLCWKAASIGVFLSCGAAFFRGCHFCPTVNPTPNPKPHKGSRCSSSVGKQDMLARQLCRAIPSARLLESERSYTLGLSCAH